MRGLGVGPITAFHNLMGPHGEGDAHHILEGKERFPQAVTQARILVSLTQWGCPLFLPLEPPIRCHWESTGPQPPKCHII